MTVVILHEAEEFLAELDRDLGRDELVAPIVRVTTIRRPVHGGAVTRLEVLAAYRARDEIVRLRMVAGDLWGVAADDGPRSRAREGVRKLESDVADRGLEIRSGMYEEASS